MSDFPPPLGDLGKPQLGKLSVTKQPTGGQSFSLTGAGNIPASVAALSLRVLTADPASPVVGEFWYRSDTSQLCVQHDASTVKRVTLA
jgi:hypothetical protein